MIPAFAYIRPNTLEQAVAALAAPGARASAGGTDLLGCLRDGVFEASTVVSLSRVKELAGISELADGGLRIGALTTLAEVAAHPAIAEKYAALGQAALAVGTPQLRNQGTLGGNLCQRPRCWFYRGGYACARKGGDTCFAMQGDNRYHGLFGGSLCYIVHPSDTATALTALGASVEVAGPQGPRIVSLEEFFVLPDTNLEAENVLAPGEIVTSIVVPAALAGTRTAFRKVRARGAWDFALASVAAVVTSAGTRVRSARLVLGAAAPAPWRVKAAEDALAGHRLDGAVIRRAAAAAMAGASPLEYNAYKVPMFTGLIEEVLESLAG